MFAKALAVATTFCLASCIDEARAQSLVSGKEQCTKEYWEEACNEEVFKAPADSKIGRADDLSNARVQQDKRTQSFKIFFGTNRAPSNSLPAGDLPAIYSAFQAESGDVLWFGWVDVTSPVNRLRGGGAEVPSPNQINTFRHIALGNHKVVQDLQEFQRAIVEKAAKTGERNLMAYVHGAFNFWHISLTRGAQIAFDIPYNGPTIVFGWPSDKKALPLETRNDTVSDYDTAWIEKEKAVEHFQTFMQSLFSFRDTTTTLLAHSMGTDLALASLAKTGIDQTSRARLRGLILAAPDVAMERYVSEYRNKLPLLARSTAIYCSPDDLALPNVGGRGGGRLGQCPDNALNYQSVEVVVLRKNDVPNIEDRLWHSYFGNSEVVLDDLQQILKAQTPAARRKDIKKDVGRGRWILKRTQQQK